jgi:hypothetical protein
MTTSGSYNFTLTRNQIIEEALRKIGRLGIGQIPSADEYRNASSLLNMIVLNLRGEGVLLYNSDFVSYPLTASNKVLGSDGYDYECIRNHSLTADTIPITGAQSLSYWRKLTTSAASAPVLGTGYASLGNITIQTSVVGISDFRLRDNTDIYDLSPITQKQYQTYNISDSNNDGIPTDIFFERRSSSRIFLYPFPDKATYLLEGFVYRYPQDFDLGSNTPDFFGEWYLHLVSALAYELAPSAGIFGQPLSDIRLQMNEAKIKANGANSEKGDLQIQPFFSD